MVKCSWIRALLFIFLSISEPVLYYLQWSWFSPIFSFRIYFPGLFPFLISFANFKNHSVISKYPLPPTEKENKMQQPNLLVFWVRLLRVYSYFRGIDIFKYYVLIMLFYSFKRSFMPPVQDWRFPYTYILHIDRLYILVCFRYFSINIFM